MSEITTPSVDWFALLPVLCVGGAAILIILARSILREHPDLAPMCMFMAVGGTGAAGVFLWETWNDVEEGGPYETLAGMVRVDGLAVFLGAVVVGATFLAVLLAIDYLPRMGFATPEYLALLLLSAAGMLVMTTANDLIVVFLALEILSIPLYVLAAFDRRRFRSDEAGIKYFVLGSFSSAVFLYGVALTYGATGTTSLAGIGRFLAANTLLDQGTLLIGIALLLVGIGFKIAAVPFHMWTPDVYEGAPTPVTAFMASATKAAGFAALLRVFLVAFPSYADDWRPIVTALAIASLVVGSFAAVVQTDVKRMLAYSSIAHAGYVLTAVVAAADADTLERGLSSALFYLLVYAVMIVGAFGVLSLLAPPGDRDHSLEHYRGLAWRHPVLSGLFVFFLLAQAGVPLTGGFLIKLQVFAAAADARQWALLIVGVLTAVVSAYVYLRIVVALMSRDEATDEETEAPAPARRTPSWTGVATGAVLGAAAIVTLWVGILPGAVLDFARDAASRF